MEQSESDSKLSYSVKVENDLDYYDEPDIITNIKLEEPIFDYPMGFSEIRATKVKEVKQNDVESKASKNEEREEETNRDCFKESSLIKHEGSNIKNDNKEISRVQSAKNRPTMGVVHLEVDSELLISLVEERPVLWDKTSDDYKDKTKTQNAWKEICVILKDGFEALIDQEKNEIGKIIVKKWTNLRDNWMKCNKKNEDQKRSGSGTKTVRKYLYHQQMLFLKKVATHRDTATNALVSEDAGERSNIPNTPSNNVDKGSASESIDVTTHPISKKKRKLDDIEVKMLKILENEKEPNRHLSFFRGLLPTLNKFDEEQTLDFQMGVLQLIKTIKRSKIDLSVSQPRPFHTTPRNSICELPQNIDHISSGTASAASCTHNNEAYTFNSGSSYQYSSKNTPISSPPTVYNSGEQNRTGFNADSPSPSSHSTVCSQDLTDLDPST